MLEWMELLKLREIGGQGRNNRTKLMKYYFYEGGLRCTWLVAVGYCCMIRQFGCLDKIFRPKF